MVWVVKMVNTSDLGVGKAYIDFFLKLRVYGIIRGRTDKKLTSTLVIWTFLSFELADIF